MDLSKRNDVPIVGQQLKILGWAPVVHMICQCEGNVPLMVVGSKASVVCRHCKRIYQLAQLNFDVASNTFNVSFAVGMVAEPEGATEKPAESALTH